MASPTDMLGDLVSDLRYAARKHAAAPGFTVVALLVLALGIGASTAIFSVVNRVLLKPMPYPDDDRLVMLWARDTRLADGKMPVAPADFRDWREQTRSFTGIAGSSDGVFNLTGTGEPEMLIGYRFEPAMFDVLGVPAQYGRVFRPEDGENVVVLGHDVWDRRFGADPSVIGRKIQLDGVSYTVLGVMPPSFTHPRRSALWVPWSIKPEVAASRDSRFVRIVGRLQPGVTLAQANAELEAVQARIAAAYPDSHRYQSAQVISLRDMDSGDVRVPILVLAGAVGFLLLLACANVAGMLIARAAGRQRELAVRVALGATRGRLVRQMVTETLLLTLVGGVFGLLLAGWATGVLVEMFPKKLGNVSIPVVNDVPLDAAVVAFSLLVAAITAVLCGLPAAITATAHDVEQTLREGATGESRRALRLRRFLVSAELALATVIAVGAGLLLRSSWKLSDTDLGFVGERTLSARLMLSEKRYPEFKQSQLVADVLERLRARPEIESAGAISTLPLSGWWAGGSVILEKGAEPVDDLSFAVAENGYFATMGIPLVSGRWFSPADTMSTPKVTLVDTRFVRKYLGGADPIGRQLNFGSDAEPEMLTVVGVVGEVLENGPTGEIRPMMYVPWSQRPWPLIALVARPRAGAAVSLAGVMRNAVWDVDGDQPISYVMTIDEMRSDATAVSRVISALFVFFAATALLLGALGVYGLTAHAVARRTREIGLRMALGARRIDVAGWVVRQALPLVLVGLAVGVGLSLALSRVLASQLFGVATYDALTLGSVALALALAAALATWVPARRASRVDPAVALRAE